MKIQIDIDSKHEESKLVIQAKEWTKEVEEVVHMLQRKQPKRVVAVEEDRSILLEPDEIDYVCAQNRKVFAVVKKKYMELKMKLYEAEETLRYSGFIRFSKSVVGNVNQIDRFELSFNGNLCVYFKSGNKEYVSRKYVYELKNQLIEGGENNDS